MAELDNISVYIKNYKCFGADEIGYDKILPINVIIGRNNSGKSSMLDLLERLTDPEDISSLGHKGQQPCILARAPVLESDVVYAFPDASHNLTNNLLRYGRQWVGEPVTWEIYPNHVRMVKLEPPPHDPSLLPWFYKIAEAKGNPFSGYTFKRLLAERDMGVEMDNKLLLLMPNGDGATNLIQRFINQASLPRDLVEEVLLGELNRIFSPDEYFVAIVIQQHDNGNWEIFLRQDEKGLIPLSNTGSGLKTILLVLIYLILVPTLEKKKLSDYLFGFEELENNLHPALLRRLLLYLRETAIEKDCTFFLTTHSSVTIDLFSSDEKAQILHVTHNKEFANVKKVTTYVDNKGILDDLEVRASDLLQANGIVWLEGPSDRLYFNRWMELITEGNIREGAHYQCLFYGGRLLAHLSASDPDVNVDEVVKILRINRNAILIIDSDKRNKDAQINSTKQRMVSEVEEIGGIAWVTAGKEIENYIPYTALASFYDNPNIPRLKSHQDFAKYLDTIKPNEGKRFLRGKVLFAEKICPHITTEGIASASNLFSCLMRVYLVIAAWNGMQAKLSGTAPCE